MILDDSLSMHNALKSQEYFFLFAKSVKLSMTGLFLIKKFEKRCGLYLKIKYGSAKKRPF